MDDTQRLANRNTLWSSAFVAELYHAGVRDAVISPGSRSTPLAIAFAQHPGIQCYAILDERSAGFFALGHGKTTGTPVALLCTSGSAVANFHPAVLEASHARIPLIALTADRPPELRDAGAAQTVDQLKFYGTAVRWFVEMGTPEITDTGMRYLRSVAARAVDKASTGPVHLNFPFRKPLEPTPVPADELEAFAKKHLLATNGLGDAPFSRAAKSTVAPDPEEIETIAKKLRATPKGWIVCGPMLSPQEIDQNDPARWPRALAALSDKTGYPVLAEPASLAHSGSHDRTNFIPHAEAVLRSSAFREKYTPDLMIQFGAPATTKHVEVMLEENPSCQVIQVSSDGAWLAPTHNPTLGVTADPTDFCETLTAKLADHAVSNNWLRTYRKASQVAENTIAGLLADESEVMGEGWFEGWVHAELSALLPEGSLQFTASSMPVRDLDVFTPTSDKTVRHLVNRGTNGIDGTVSSALGAATAWKAKGKGPAAMVVGDIAFFHDANGLLVAQQHSVDMTIILINNHGGGIFDFLPIAEYGEVYETFFATPHNLDFKSLAAAFGIGFTNAKTKTQFREMVQNSLQQPGTQVIEVTTDRRQNRILHRQVWEAVAQALETVVHENL